MRLLGVGMVYYGFNYNLFTCIKSGIASPLRNTTEFFSESINLDKENRKNIVSDSLNYSITSNTIADLLIQANHEEYKETLSNHFQEDVDILLQQMDIKPKQVIFDDTKKFISTFTRICR